MISRAGLAVPVSKLAPVTSVLLRASTVRRLREIKPGAQSWDQFFRDWLEWTMDSIDLEEARRAVAEIRTGRATTTSGANVRKHLKDWAAN